MPIAVFTFTDNNGKKAECRLHLGTGQDHSAAAELAAALASSLQGVSDARLVSFDLIYSFPHAGPPPPVPVATVFSFATLFYRNGDEVSSIRVPGGGFLPTDADGRYAGVRVSRDVAGVSGVLPVLDSLLVGFTDAAKRTYGDYFSVGITTGGSQWPD